jgi:hypothetical protein
MQEEEITDNFEEKLADLEAEDERRDLARKVGDIAVYRYYYQAIGAKKLIVFVLFVSLNVFSGSFSSKWI